LRHHLVIGHDRQSRVRPVRSGKRACPDAGTLYRIATECHADVTHSDRSGAALSADYFTGATGYKLLELVMERLAVGLIATVI
jgi:hypothetical protein